MYTDYEIVCKVRGIGPLQLRVSLISHLSSSPLPLSLILSSHRTFFPNGKPEIDIRS